MTEINPEVLVHLLHAPYELARKQCGGWLLQAMPSAHSHIRSVGIDLHRSLRLSPPPPKRVALSGDVATAFCSPQPNLTPPATQSKVTRPGYISFIKLWLLVPHLLVYAVGCTHSSGNRRSQMQALKAACFSSRCHSQHFHWESVNH